MTSAVFPIRPLYAKFVLGFRLLQSVAGSRNLRNEPLPNIVNTVEFVLEFVCKLEALFILSHSVNLCGPLPLDHF